MMKGTVVRLARLRIMTMITKFISPVNFETEDYRVKQPNCYTIIITNKTDHVIAFNFYYLYPLWKYPEVFVMPVDPSKVEDLGIVIQPHKYEKFYWDLDLVYNLPGVYEIPGYAECEREWRIKENEKQKKWEEENRKREEKEKKEREEAIKAGKAPKKRKLSEGDLPFGYEDLFYVDSEPISDDLKALMPETATSEERNPYHTDKPVTYYYFEIYVDDLGHYSTSEIKEVTTDDDTKLAEMESNGDCHYSYDKSCIENKKHDVDFYIAHSVDNNLL